MAHVGEEVAFCAVGRFSHFLGAQSLVRRGLQVGEVEHDPMHFQRLTAGIDARGDCGAHVLDGAVNDEAMIEGARAAGGAQLRQRGLDPWPVIRMSGREIRRQRLVGGCGVAHQLPQFTRQGAGVGAQVRVPSTEVGELLSALQLIFRIGLSAHGPPPGDLRAPDGNAVEEGDRTRDQHAEGRGDVDPPHQLAVAVGSNGDAHVTDHLAARRENRRVGANAHSPCGGGGFLLHRQAMGSRDLPLARARIVDFHGR